MERCTKCNSLQYSAMDKNYLKIYGECWSCDKNRWERDMISTEEFEAREEQAFKTI